jgi:hypothetical protein
VPQKPDGNRPSDRITFTRGAAERISEVVRTVELGNRDGQPLRFQKVPCGSPGGDSEVRFALWTATTNWLVVSPRGVTTTNNTKVVQFAFPLETALNGTNVVTFSAGPTVHCINHLARIQRRATSTTSSFALQTLVIAREAGQWRLIGAEC